MYTHKYNNGRKYNGWIKEGFESALFVKHKRSIKGPSWCHSPVFPNWYMCIRPLIQALDSTRFKHDILALLITSKPFRDSAYSLVCMAESTFKDQWSFYYLRNRCKPWRLERQAKLENLKVELNPLIKQLYREFKKW